MKEWVENHLLTSRKDKLSGKRINKKWFLTHGFKDQYEDLVKINPDLLLACKIVLGWTSTCKQCSNIVVLPRVYCSTKCQVNDPEWKEQKKQTMLARYGVESAFKSKELRNKAKKTMVEKYGVEYSWQSKELLEKRDKTIKERYGVDHIMCSEKIKEELRQRNIEKYGVDNPMKRFEVREKVKQTNLKRYGSISPASNDEVKIKSKATITERYGDHHTKLPEVQNKKKLTCLEKYNVEYASQKHYSKELLDEIERNLINVSGPNDDIFDEISLKTIYTLLNRYRPELVSSQMSSTHKELSDYIRSICKFEIIDNDRAILGGKEIDIYIPELKLGFEFNGTYWHSDNFKTKKYHQEKSLLAKQKGFRLVHLYEYDGFEYNKLIIENQINKTNNRIFARKCVVKEIDSKTTSSFLSEHHRQGNSRSSVRIGLFYENELVQVMTFSKPRFNKKYEWELIRMSTKRKLSVVGGSSKLLSFFKKEYNPKSIISYSSLDNGFNTVYEKIGFKFVSISSPSYVWVSNTQVMSRYQTQMVNEDNIMRERGFLKIYNAGNEIFDLVI